MNNNDIKTIANACIALWNQLKFSEAYELYYAEDAVKCEPTAIGDYPNEIQGRDTLAAQEESIQNDLMETHSISVSEGPFIGANGFSVIIKSDFTVKATQERHIFREVGVYTVKEEKIVREEFFFDEAEHQMAVKLAE